MRYIPKTDRRKKLHILHIEACRLAATLGRAYTWLWIDGGITHMVGGEARSYDVKTDKELAERCAAYN